MGLMFDLLALVPKCLVLVYSDPFGSFISKIPNKKYV